MGTKTSAADMRVVTLAVVAVVGLLGTPGCRPARSAPGGRRAAAAAPTATSCQEVITATDAQLIFRRLTALRANDRCVMSDLVTRQSLMHVLWTRDGVALPDDAVVTPAACAPRSAVATGRYVIQAGARFASTCPSTVTALNRTFALDAPAPTRVTNLRPERRRAPLVVAGLVAFVVLGALGALVWRRRTSLP